MNIIEDYNKNGYEITIGYDEADWLFEDLWHDVTFISNHRSYGDQGPLKHLTIEHVLDNDIPEGYEAIPVTAYIHSLIALTVSESGYPFNCRFDSGTFGFVLFKTGEFGDNNIGLEGFVKHWANIVNGDIYYFTISQDDEILESCGGFDDMDYMKKEIDSILDDMVEYSRLERLKRVKTMIKNRVPLDKRTEAIA